MRQTELRITMMFLLVTAAAGLAMRGMAFTSWGSLRYDYVLHAHSHLAILGWAYAALFLFILRCFSLHDRTMRICFWASQATAAAMFAAFVYQGYAVLSIAFSTLHILLSYGWLAAVWRRLRGQATLPARMLKGSLAALAVSSLGPWGLAVTSAAGMKDSPMYEMAIYFYLHFQYNGWLTLGLGAVLLQWLYRQQEQLSDSRVQARHNRLAREQPGNDIVEMQEQTDSAIAPGSQNRLAYSRQARLLERCFRWYFVALFPGYLLSILWIKPGLVLTVGAGIFGWVQWGAVVGFVWIVCKEFAKLGSDALGGSPGHRWPRRFLRLAAASLLLKATMELGLTFPALGEMVYGNRSIVIGYLHLTLLGFVSFLLIGMWLASGMMNGAGKGFSTASWLFVSGFLLNEWVLFMQGLLAWMKWPLPLPHPTLLLLAALLMAGGCVIYTAGRYYEKDGSTLTRWYAAGGYGGLNRSSGRDC